MLRTTLFLSLMGFILASCSFSTPNTNTTTPENQNASQNTINTSWEGLGTEPFWAFRYVDGDFTWQQPGETGVLEETASGTQSENNGVITIIAGDFTGILTPGTCSDGMSENQYPYTLSVTKGTGSLTGCARPYTP